MLKNIYRQVLLLAAYSLAVYLALFAASHALYPEKKTIDTKLSRRGSIYYSDATHVVLGRNVLMTDSKKIFFLGSSNVRFGLRPEEFKAHAPGYDIHNMSVGGSNFNQVRQVTQLILEVTPRESLRKSIFVFGMIPDTFLDDASSRGVHGGVSRVREQQIKWRGLYTRRGRDMVPALRPRGLYFITEFYYPFLLLNKIPNRIKEIDKGIVRRVIKPPQTPNFPQDMDVFLNAAVADERIRNRDTAYWKNVLKHRNNQFPEDQFRIMVGLARQTTDAGAIAVFVDLPYAKWIKQNNACFDNYQMQKLKYIQALAAIPNAYYFNMQDLDHESYFYDYAHPKPRYSYLWSDRLAQDLRMILR